MKLIKTRSFALIVSFIFFLTAVCFAAHQEVKLLAGDYADADQFGRSVDISGNYMIIGAPEDDDLGNRSGSAYIFKWESTAWVQDAKLLAPDGLGNEQFGYAVSISSDYALIGAFRNKEHGNQAGAAYIWHRNGNNWQYMQKLTPSIPEPNSEFGNSVDINGNIAVIGAHRSQHLGNMTGAAYVFRRNGSTWNEEAKIVEDSLSPSAFFGCDAYIGGITLIVGAYKDGNSGAAYYYNYDGSNWILKQKLTPDDPIDNAAFGCSISSWSPWILIGANGADGSAPDTGAAYVFHLDCGVISQTTKLSPEPPVPDQSFGWDVSINDGYAIVGAPYFSNDTVQMTGKIYVYTLDEMNWLPRLSLVASDSNQSAFLGFSVATQSDEAIVGAFGAAHETAFPGAAYWFQDFSIPSPTPTPSTITYDVHLYDNDLAEGDLFKLTRTCYNPGTTLGVDEYIILDVYGSFWFWPGWSETIDFKNTVIPSGIEDIIQILEFSWPYVDGTAEDLKFWGALLDEGSLDLLIYDVVNWRYSNK